MGFPAAARRPVVAVVAATVLATGITVAVTGWNRAPAGSLAVDAGAADGTGASLSEPGELGLGRGGAAARTRATGTPTIGEAWSAVPPSPTTPPAPSTASPASRPSPAPPPAPQPAPPAAAPQPAPAAPAPAGGVPLPGQVGFRGDPATLTVIDSAATAPAGTQWGDGYLIVTADDLTLDRVLVRGGIDFSGRGTLTVRDSIVEGGGSWMVVMGQQEGCHLDIRDSTLRWRAGSTPEVGNGNGAVHGHCTMTVLRNDISGTADGIQNGPGNSLIEQNWIHDLALLGSYPDNSHNDGIQAYGGSGLVIRHNRIEIGFDGEHQNAAVFLQGRFQAPVITGNHLEGGGFFLRLEDGVAGAVVTDNTFGPRGRAWGEYLGGERVVATWERNTDAAGAPVPAP